jgi:hypothetical protein
MTSTPPALAAGGWDSGVKHLFGRHPWSQRLSPQMRPPSPLLLPIFTHSHELIRHLPNVVQPQDIAIGTTSANSRVEDCLMRKPVSLSPSQSETPTIPSLGRSWVPSTILGVRSASLRPYNPTNTVLGHSDQLTSVLPHEMLLRR